MSEIFNFLLLWAAFSCKVRQNKIKVESIYIYECIESKWKEEKFQQNARKKLKVSQNGKWLVHFDFKTHFDNL